MLERGIRRCKKCPNLISVTNGTAFDSGKKSLRLWFYVNCITSLCHLVVDGAEDRHWRKELSGHIWIRKLPGHMGLATEAAQCHDSQGARFTLRQSRS